MNEVTKRFIEAYYWLLKENKISDQKDFASQIGVSTSMITEILKERSNVGLSAIQNTVLKFDINSQWLLTGKEGKYISEDLISEPPGQYKSKIIDAQTETIETQRKFIMKLEEENEQLKKLLEKEKPGEDGQKRRAV